MPHLRCSISHFQVNPGLTAGATLVPRLRRWSLGWPPMVTIIASRVSTDPGARRRHKGSREPGKGSLSRGHRALRVRSSQPPVSEICSESCGMKRGLRGEAKKLNPVVSPEMVVGKGRFFGYGSRQQRHHGNAGTLMGRSMGALTRKGRNGSDIASPVQDGPGLQDE